jgi:Lrp/AsnC family leucine-responsive transcriptional regulator
MNHSNVDEKDRKIIDILGENSRSSLRDIGDEVKLSPSSVRNRMTSLIEDGVIHRYTVDVDHRKLGYEVQVIVLITSKPGFSEELYWKLKSYEQISQVYWTSGPANFVSLIRFRNMHELSKFMTEKLEKLDGIERVESMFVMPPPE